MSALYARLRRAVAWLSLGHRLTAIAMVVLVVHYAVTWGAYQGKAAGDGWFAFLYLKAIVFYRSLDMKLVAPEYLRFFGETGPGHHMPNRCPIGPVFVWLPFYLLVAVPETILRAVHVIPAKWAFGASPFHVWVTGLSTLGIVLVGWRQLLKLYLRYLSDGAAQLGAALTIWATPMLWYTSHHPFYQHGIAYGVVAILIEYWDRTRGQNHYARFVLIGALGGYAMTVRAQELVWLMPVCLEIAWHLGKGPARARWLVGGVILVAAALVAFSPQVLVWHYYSGGWAPVQSEPLRPHDPFFLVVLFSTRSGLFPWTPICYAAVVGLVLVAVQALRRRTPPGLGVLTAACFVVFLADLYIVACAWMVTGGFSYGNRRLMDCVVLIGLGVGFLVDQLSSRPMLRKLVLGFAVFAVLMNFLLVEMLRLRKYSSPGGGTRSLAQVLEYELHAPTFIVGLARNVGYPFCQPVGWIWSALHHTRPATFELVHGSFLLDRDSQWRSVLNHTLALDRKNRDNVVTGLHWTDDTTPPTVTGPVRVIAEMFAEEVVDLTIEGTFAGNVELRWNGAPVPVRRVPKGFAAVVPKDLVHTEANDIDLVAPLGSTMTKLEFGSRGGWW